MKTFLLLLGVIVMLTITMLPIANAKAEPCMRSPCPTIGMNRG
uniref:Venom peptide ECTX1-Rm60a n=1 Tax=Rhytidoponera metallica TaxID=148364 RepID=A0A8U0LTT5_RHYMT|nr:venom peptide precursor ECTX1-Rm60a [Rhytidoponera metallica]